MCWRFLRDFWTDLVFGSWVSSEERERGADVPGPERGKGKVVGGKEV